MSFCIYSKDNFNTGKTLVDNLFLSNYMPEAPQDAVKVYLYGLYLCQNNEPQTILDMANSLSLTESEVKDLFKYWEEFGLLSITSYEPFTVTYFAINDNQMKYKRFKPEKYTDFTKAIQSIITERMISVSEFSEYFSIMENTAMKPEALLMIAKYCSDLKGSNISYKYIIATAKDFTQRGLTTPDLVEKELSGYTTKSKEVAEVLRELKSSKNPEIEDIQLYKKWTNNYQFEHDFIIKIIKIAKIKNIKKLDNVIEELFANRIFDEENCKEYIENKDKLFKLALEISKKLGLYIEVLDNVVANYVSPWKNKGFDDDTLLFLANYCFKSNKRSLESMNETVLKLYKQGLITLNDITEYMNLRNVDNAFIKNILEIVGLNRKPNDWDRENLKIWRSWNFTDEIIMEAVKKATGIRNYIPYVSTVLSTWKNKGAFTLEEISKVNITTNNNNQNKGNHFANERTYSEEEYNSMLASIDDIKV